MEPYESPVRYLAVTVTSGAASLLYIILNINNTAGLTYSLISLCICYPIIMVSMYHWLTGHGIFPSMSLDKSQYTEQEIREYVSYTGFWHMVFSILLLFGLSLIFVNAFIGLSISVLAVMILVLSMVQPALGKDVNGLIELKSETAALIIGLIVILSLVPTTLMFVESSHNIENNEGNGYNPFKLNDPFGTIGGTALEDVGAYIEEYAYDAISAVEDVFIDITEPVQLPSGLALDTVFYNIHSMTVHGMV